MEVPAPRKTRLFIPARGMPTTRTGGRRRRPSAASSPNTRAPAPPARRPVPLLPPTPPSLPPPGRPATRRRSAVLARAWGRGRARCRPGTPLPLGFAGRPNPLPRYLGRRRERSRLAGGRATAGRRGTRRRPARPASGPWRARARRSGGGRNARHARR